MTSIGDMRCVMRVDIDSLSIAIDVASVREIIGEIEVTSIPGPRGLVGVTPWDGRALAVVDLGALLGLESLEKRPRTLIVEVRGATLAMPVDRAYEPRETRGAEDAHARRIPFADLEISLDGQGLPLFDVSSLVASFEGPFA
jgi:chemotaxis signal transduction protein